MGCQLVSLELPLPRFEVVCYQLSLPAFPFLMCESQGTGSEGHPQIQHRPELLCRGRVRAGLRMEPEHGEPAKASDGCDIAGICELLHLGTNYWYCANLLPSSNKLRSRFPAIAWTPSPTECSMLSNWKSGKCLRVWGQAGSSSHKPFASSIQHLGQWVLTRSDR